jgi:2-polyprenyl-6-methoxyphenol hydroxylase-like FAD-dependent oxidoreductase
MDIESNSHRNRAVVIGGSVAGLLAARVLADFYREVILLERDDFNEAIEPRRGVPHGRHAHGLLAGGQRVLEKLFPGILAEMIRDGAVAADPHNDGTWFFEGAALYKSPSGTEGVISSRPFLEAAIRRRTLFAGNVRLLSNQPVRMLTSTQDKSRITGVVTEDRTIEADLVVDGTGRGSRSGVWLEGLGFKSAREEKVEIELVYTTRSFRLRHIPEDKFMVIAPTPDGKRGGVMARQEGDAWIVTLFGHFGQVAPNDLDGFIEYSRTLPSPLIYNAIWDAEPVTEAVNFRFPASTRRHYEELPIFPQGYLVFGDAICSFNPIFGQGMSVAALQAEALQLALSESENELAPRFFERASAVIDNPWNIAVGADLRMPETVGPRSTASDLINWYISNVHRRAHNDQLVSLAFCKVAQLLAAPSTLVHPSILWRVLADIIIRKLRSDGESARSRLTPVEPSRRLPSDGF